MSADVRLLRLSEDVVTKQCRITASEAALEVSLDLCFEYRSEKSKFMMEALKMRC